MKVKQNELTKRKMLYVDFICHELKMPLQLIANAIDMTDVRMLDTYGTAAARRIIANVHEVVSMHILVHNSLS